MRKARRAGVGPGRRRRRRVLAGTGVVLGVALAAAGIWVAVRWDQVADIPGLPSAYEAKEMCSCLFVEGRSQEHCERFVRQDTLPVEGRVIDREQKTVTVRALWTSSRARHVSRRHGCVLE